MIVMEILNRSRLAHASCTKSHAIETSLSTDCTLVVVDLSLTRGDGIGMIRRFRDRFPKTKMIVISVFDEPSVSKAVLEAGTNGFVLKRAIANRSPSRR